MSPQSTSRPAMLILGLLGGMSWEPSAYYYRLLNEWVRDAAFALPAATP